MENITLSQFRKLKFLVPFLPTNRSKCTKEQFLCALQTCADRHHKKKPTWLADTLADLQKKKLAHREAAKARVACAEQKEFDKIKLGDRVCMRRQRKAALEYGVVREIRGMYHIVWDRIPSKISKTKRTSFGAWVSKPYWDSGFEMYNEEVRAYFITKD